MPVIPTFDTNVSVPTTPSPPRADPAAFSQVGAALSQGSAEVAGVANQWAQRYKEARQASDAAGLVASGTTQFDDLSAQLSKLPDAASAEQQFHDQADKIRQSLVAQSDDPLVQSHVDQQLQMHAAMRQELTRARAFGVESSQKVADLQSTRLPGYANTMSMADDPMLRNATLDQMGQDMMGMAHAGWITPDQAVTMQSNTLRSAVETRAATDPIGAQALLNNLQGRLTAPDMARLQEMLKMAVPRRQALNTATTIANGTMPSGAAAVRDGLIARGLAPDDATALAANAMAESSGQPNAVNPDGSSRGLFQLTGDRRTAFKTQYGVEPDQASMDQQLDFAVGELKGPENAAYQKIQAATGVADKAAAASQYYLRPADTQGQAVNRANIASMMVGGPNATPEQKLATLRAATKDLPPEAQEQSEFMLVRQLRDDAFVKSGQQSALGRQTASLEQAYLSGETDQEPPTAVIRQTFPPDKADEIIQKLNLTRQAGDLFAGIKYAAPDQEQAALKLLQTPGSISSGSLPVQDHQIVPPPGGVVPGNETPDQLILRQGLLGMLQRQIQQKHDALAKDPAAYAAAQSDMQTTLKAVDPNDPASRTAALQKLLDVQGQLGIPDRDRRVMTNSQVASTVQDLTTGDPATVNVASRLDALRDQYGDLWPRAFGDLVKTGHLDPKWQVVANMTDPSQAAARSEMVRLLQTTAAPGGIKQITESVPPDAKKLIDKNLADDLAPFRATMSVPGQAGNLDLTSGMTEAIRNLAYMRAMQGKDGETALSSAVNDVLNAQYDFDGNLRTPKGLMPQAQAMASKIQGAITPDDIKPPPTGDASLTPQQNAEIIATAAKRSGNWVTNEHDDGAVLMAPLRNGAWMPVIRKDGSRVEFKWSDAQAAPTTTNMPDNSADIMMGARP